MSDKTSKLKNIGPTTRAWLHEIGVDTEDDLRALGVAETWLRLKARFPDRVSLNALYGLEGALSGVPWNQLPEEVKQELRRQVGAE